ncbi:50S ribosomal protein L1 [Sesamum alatum]|uniref:CL1 n=1 Tax=Sesamum alatum TaxID=300844 RepID=A0AAE1Y0A3_9LAMI|nr:50S ribosomal protein L1 [Sesamum alatum]
MIYDLKEAIRLVKANAKRNFDETFEVHVKMTPDLRRTDLKLSGFVRLPHGFGKTYRVAVFAEGAAAEEARDAGADIVGGPELVENIRTGQVKVDFDKCISTPSMMEHVKKLSRNLKQLMPDTKKGTLTNDISHSVKEAKEQSVSFSEDALRENVGAFVNALLLAKPAGLKKSSKYAGYVDSFHVCSTMGPSFPISVQSLSMAADRFNRLQLR